jgi:hypothetical protein
VARLTLEQVRSKIRDRIQREVHRRGLHLTPTQQRQIVEMETDRSMAELESYGTKQSQPRNTLEVEVESEGG